MTSKDPAPPPPRTADAQECSSPANAGTKEGRRVLVQHGDADAVRRGLAGLGITEADVADAVTWARAAGRGALPRASLDGPA